MNASDALVATANRCAAVLKGIIAPFIIQRKKANKQTNTAAERRAALLSHVLPQADVGVNLPRKQEHILFCGLTPEQRNLYLDFLKSSSAEMVAAGRKHVRTRGRCVGLYAL